MSNETSWSSASGDNNISNGSVSHIIDIRRRDGAEYLAQEIKNSLKTPESPQAPRRMPSLLLWNQEGLRLFEKITYLEEYYLTQAEIGILERMCKEIALKIKPNSLLVELGSGNLRKIKLLLQALDNLGISVDYYALDLSLPELQRTLDTVPPGSYTHVRCHGLLGTYDDSRAWLQRPENMRKPRCIISLGNSIGSFTRPDAATFLASFADVLECEPNSLASPKNHSSEEICLIVGLDACKDGAKVSRAYNDASKMNEGFIFNALKHANSVLGYTAFRDDEWYVKGEWDAVSGSHDQFVIPRRDIELFEGVSLKAGEKILVIQSRKYDAEEKVTLWRKAHLSEVGRWSNEDESYGIHMLCPTSKSEGC